MLISSDLISVCFYSVVFIIEKFLSRLVLKNSSYKNLNVIECGPSAQSMNQLKMEAWFRNRLPAYNSSDNEPDTLFEQCIRYLVLNLRILVDPHSSDDAYHPREGLTLPSEICERLLEAYQQAGEDVNDRFVHLFQNSAATKLKRIRLKNSSISDYGLSLLLNHNLLELDISNCMNLTERSFFNLNEKANNLVSLSVGCSRLLLRTLCTKVNLEESKPRYILMAPNLRKLSVHDLNIFEPKLYYKHLFKPLTKLTHLDVSYSTNLNDLSCLTNLQCLTSLILFNVTPLFPVALESIIKLKSLRHLDVSQVRNGTYPDPNQTLATLVENLPNLVSLDISGTNLAGTGIAIHIKKNMCFSIIILLYFFYCLFLRCC